MDVREIRLHRLQQLLDDHHGSKVDLAATIKKQPAQVSQWFNGVRTISEFSARDIEKNAKLPARWMDTLPISLSTGSGKVAYSVQETAEPHWPFERIDRRAVERLTPAQLHDVETAMLAIAAQLGVRLQKRAAA